MKRNEAKKNHGLHQFHGKTTARTTAQCNSPVVDGVFPRAERIRQILYGTGFVVFLFITKCYWKNCSIKKNPYIASEEYRNEKYRNEK